jgi:hypothetical protein
MFVSLSLCLWFLVAAPSTLAASYFSFGLGAIILPMTFFCALNLRVALWQLQVHMNTRKNMFARRLRARDIFILTVRANLA